MGNPNENFRRHCSRQMGRNPLWPRSSDSGSSALKPQTASCIPTFRAQTFRRTTDGGGEGRQRRREGGGRTGDGGRTAKVNSSVRKPSKEGRREGGKEGRRKHMIFSSSSSASSSSSSYGRRASEAALPPSCPCSVRPSLPHSAALNSPQRLEFQIIVRGGRETAGGRGERESGKNEAHVTELGRGSRWRRG